MARMSLPARSIEIRGEESPSHMVTFEFEGGDDYVSRLKATAAAEGLQCTTRVKVAADDGLDAFLAGLVEDWRGWAEPRHWTALEGLQIVAAHHGATIELRFALTGRDEWSISTGRNASQVQIPIVITPGESLRRIAQDAAGLYGTTEP
jgi:hypothetical protein